jgi:hypothetical protein
MFALYFLTWLLGSAALLAIGYLFPTLFLAALILGFTVSLTRYLESRS